MNQSLREQSTAPLRPGYVRYVLLLIFLVAVFNTGDRTILSVLVDDIKAELGLDDRQMGFVLGFAFSLAHMLLGIPLARLADRVSRRSVVALSLFGWSAMTALMGTAQNFAQLALTRAGVGIGEAGGSPACHALIASHVPPARRARAMALLSIGALAGLGLGASYGAWASAQFGWRLALIGAGAPGVLLALLFWCTVRDGESLSAAAPESLGVILRQLWRSPGFVWLTAAATFATMTSMGRMLWEPALLRRVFLIEQGQLGTWYFAVSVLPSALGAWLGATLVDRLAAADRRWYAWLPALAAVALVPLAALFYLWPEQHRVAGVPVAFVFCIGMSLLGAIWGPATMTLAQVIVPERGRAVGAATWTMIANFIGYGVGAMLVGDLSIRFGAVFGTDGLRYALLVLASLSLLTAWLFHKLALALRCAPSR